MTNNVVIARKHLNQGMMATRGIIELITRNDCIYWRMPKLIMI